MEIMTGYFYGVIIFLYPPRLPICLLGDSLYSCESLYEVCKQNNWEFSFRYNLLWYNM